MIRSSRGQQLKRVFEDLDKPAWNAVSDINANVLHSTPSTSQPVRMTPLSRSSTASAPAAAVQTLVQQIHDGQQ